MLSRYALMCQASFFECLVFDLLPSFGDGTVSAKIDIGRGQVAEDFVIAMVMGALDEGNDVMRVIIADWNLTAKHPASFFRCEFPFGER